MLLFGSRSVSYSVPNFRKAQDWDLVGTEEDLARLSKSLRIYTEKPATPEKTIFWYEGCPLELLVRRPGDYWTQVCEAFADEPVIDLPILGRVSIAPGAYTLVTKQVSLIYRIHHWHKNLQDFFFLRNHIETIPPSVEALYPISRVHAREHFSQKHGLFPAVPVACHPALPNKPDLDQHAEFHERVRRGARPLVSEPNAWKGFPHLQEAERTERMRDLLAEEAIVFAAHCRADERGLSTARSDSELKRFALREIAMSHLPEDWRYFTVNHYREIAELIPEDWGKLVEDLVGPAPAAERAPERTVTALERSANTTSR